MRQVRATLAGVLVVLGAGGCGGKGDGSGPSPTQVATVTVVPVAPEVQVGATISVVTTYANAQGTLLSGRNVTYQTSNTSLATVSNIGGVTGVAPGVVTISALVDGISGSANITVTAPSVAQIAIDQRTPLVLEGATVALTVKTFDFLGHPLTGRDVEWSSSDPTMATVNLDGLVSGVAAGTPYIRAESEGKKDSVRLRVKSLHAPQVTGGAPALLTPGITATVTGQNFGPTPNDNEVLVNGVKAAISAASATSISFKVPSAQALPCVANDATIPVIVLANADSAPTTRQIRLAQTRTLNVGESLVLTNAADITCTEFAGNGGTYLLTAFNYAETPAVRTSFALVGTSKDAPVASVSPSATTLSRATAEAAVRAQAFAQQMQLPGILQRHLANHLSQMRRENAMAQAHPAARRVWRTKRSMEAQAMLQSGASASVQAVAPTGPAPAPNVGDKLDFRMCPASNTSISWCDNWSGVRGRVVYVGPKLIIYEDSLAPLAGQMDAEYQRIGQEFDARMYGYLSSFGRPLAADTDMHWYGHIIAVFSPRVNRYYNGGILGFVTACDAFPRTDAQGNDCPSSNEGAFFYSIVPDPNNDNTSQRVSIADWRRVIRGTLAHEAKHITALSERYVHDADRPFDDAWLEEATAQQASELWARDIYGFPQKSDIDWTQGPQCDYWPSPDGTCTDPVEAILHHFFFLYVHYAQNEFHSILSDPTGFIPLDRVIYGSSWSFARYVTDVFGSTEGDFLRSLTMVTNDAGVANITDKAGHPFWELFGLWSLATLADNFPTGTINDPRLRLPSWQTRGIFEGMNQHLVTGSPPHPAFPRPFPLVPRVVNFGAWDALQQQVADLPGGGFAAWHMSGSQYAPQVIALRAPDGSPLPTSDKIGLAIVRIE
jgi:hypothetical protein